MKHETKEQVAFMSASLIELTNMMDMSESGLPYVVELVGTKAIRKLMRINRLYYELSFEDMAEEICTFIGWEPMLVIPWRTDEELEKIGHRIADLVEDNFPADEDVAESLFVFLTWDGIGAWLSVNDG